MSTAERSTAIISGRTAVCNGHRSSRLGIDWKWIDHDPDLDSLRNEPGFREVVARRPVEDVA